MDQLLTSTRISERFNRITLIFDDGYLVSMLHKLEAILEQNPEAWITLFPDGEVLLNNQSKEPGVWKRFYDKGHEIGNHSFNHANLELVSAENVLADYDRWLDPELAKRGIQPGTLSRMDLDWIKGQNESTGCDTDPVSLMRTCIE